MSVLLLTTGTSDEHQVLTMFFIYIYITMKCLAFHVKFKGVHGA